jgi:hypothetical protein
MATNYETGFISIFQKLSEIFFNFWSASVSVREATQSPLIPLIRQPPYPIRIKLRVRIPIRTGLGQL